MVSMFVNWESVVMAYLKEEAIAGITIEVSKKHSYRFQQKGIPRSKNTNPTPEDVKKYNEKKAETNLRRLINHNFRYKDIHLVLTYRRNERPSTPQEAKKDLEKFLRKLRDYFRKRNRVLKYIAVTEYKNTAIHHHLIINSMDTRDLTDLWTKGQPRPTYMDNTGQYGKLASYLIKETSKTFNSEGRVHGKRWCASTNLEKPKINTKAISAHGWDKDPKPKKGYYIEKDSIRSGVHEKTGYPYFFYRMIKIPENGT